MKLLIAILHEEDSDRIVDALTDSGFRVTHVASSGGFLKKRNSTLMIGAEDEQVDGIFDVIRSHARPHKPTQDGHAVAGATVFVVPVTQFERL